MSALGSGCARCRCRPAAPLSAASLSRVLWRQLQHLGQQRAPARELAIAAVTLEIARTPAARRDILASIERVFSRAELEDRDARAWHLMLRALGSTLTPKDLGLPPAEPRTRHKLLADRAKAAGRPRKKG